MKLYKKNTTKNNLNKKGSSIDLYNVFQRKHTHKQTKKNCELFLWNCSVSSVETVRFKGNCFFDSEKSVNNQTLQFFCTFENHVNTIWI